MQSLLQVQIEATVLPGICDSTVSITQPFFSGLNTGIFDIKHIGSLIFFLNILLSVQVTVRK